MTTRITLGKIESLVGDKEVIHMGKAIFKRKNPWSKRIVFSLPLEKIEFEMSENPPRYNPLDGTNDCENEKEASLAFISAIEGYFHKREFYLAEASFKNYRFKWDLPFSEKLEGELYQSNKSK